MGARGPASDIPALVRQLATEPEYQHPPDSHLRGPDKQKIADALGCTRQRVQQILSKPTLD